MPASIEASQVLSQCCMSPNNLTNRSIIFHIIKDKLKNNSYRALYTLLIIRISRKLLEGCYTTQEVVTSSWDFVTLCNNTRHNSHTTSERNQCRAFYYAMINPATMAAYIGSCSVDVSNIDLQQLFENMYRLTQWMPKHETPRLRMFKPTTDF